MRAYERLLELKPDDPTSREAIERADARRKKWNELVARYLDEAGQTSDAAFRSSLLMSAADVAFRYGPRTESALEQVCARLDEAFKLDPRNLRASSLLERIYRTAGDWGKAAEVLETTAREAQGKDDRAAALVRLARIYARKLRSQAKAVSAYERVLYLWPGDSEAMQFLSDHFSKAEEWDHLVTLYEDQLRAGLARTSDESGIVFQIAMVNWKMRKRPDLAETYFDRLRRFEPAHAGMLAFFREVCTERGDTARLLTILTDAQRAIPEGEARMALATEIAKLAESGANAQKAIEQYKAILRQNSNHREARTALKRLYAATEGWNALIELLRQDLERTAADDKDARLKALREIAAVYRDRIKSDTALVTVLTQIVQLDASDIDALRELTRVYEALGRWRDLLQHQTTLAALLPVGEEKAQLYRSIARRWLEQFSNVQNATDAFEALLSVAPGDAEAIAKLKELYTKRRAWPQLFSLYERELEVTTGVRRAEVLGEMAKLAAERLDRGADAVRIYKQILEEDPSRTDVLDHLERQAERDKDFATVAWALERRLVAAPNDAARLAVLQKLGPVYSDRLSDHAGAIKTWQRVLQIQPGHAKALRVLRDAYLASGDFDSLEHLYEVHNDWEGLAEVLSTAADRTNAPELKVDLSFRTARVLTDNLNAPERAFRSYERILGVRPDDPTAAAALVQIYEKEEKWARLPALYEVLLAAAQEPDDKLALYGKLIDTTGQRLADRATALVWARTAYELSPDAERLEWLEGASRAAHSWDSFVDAVANKLKKKKGVSPKERRALRLKLARLYSTELGRVDEAVAAYRALVEEEPEDEESILVLDRLLRAEDRRDDLRWLFELRAGHGSDEARAAILTEWASLEQDVFGDLERATDLYSRVLELEPANDNAARTLPRLLLSAGRAAEAANVIEAHRDRLSGQARAVRDLDLAEIYLDYLPSPAKALACAARSLDVLPHQPHAIAILDRLLAFPESRPRAAELLETEYAHSSDFRHQALALTIMLETVSEPQERLRLYWRLAEIEETRLSAAGRALDVILRALGEFPENLDVWERASQLAIRAGRLTDLADAFRTALSRPHIASEVELELCDRAATLHDERLGDPQAATPYLERILARNAGDEKAFGRLKQILTSSERWGELEALYSQAIKGTTDPARRIDLLNEVALVCEEITNEAGKAIAYYEAIFDLNPSHENALRALEQLYAREGLYPKLAALLEHRLETADQPETISLKVRLAQIHLDRLHQPQRALDHLEEVLRLDVTNPDARLLVERILDIGSLRTRAARILEAVYEARDEIRDLVRVLEIQLEGADSDPARRALLQRIASLRDERLRDDAGAMQSLSMLVPLDPTDAVARGRLSEIGGRLGAHEQVALVLSQAAEVAADAPLRSEILMDVARIFESEVRDLARAEAFYKSALAIDPDDAELSLPPARALERLYSGSGNHHALADTLGIQVALEDSAERRSDLLGRLGQICEDVLSDPVRAISAWKRRLADDPTDDLALTSLERLYERTSAFRELCEVLRAREQNASDATLRQIIMAKTAQVLDEKLDDKPNAILAYRAVIDEFGPDRATLSALEKLYEATGRFADLAECLDVDLGLADDTNARIELLARLGEVRRRHQDDWTGALEAFQQALSLDPNHAASRTGIEKMLEVADARKAAAETLHPLYEADGDYEHLLRVLEIEADAADTPYQKLRLLEQAVKVAEDYCRDAGRAFDYAVHGVQKSASESEVTAWIQRVEGLAQVTDRYPELVTLLRDTVPEILDEQVQLDVSLRIGDLSRFKLNDLGLARLYYQRALDLRGDDRRVLSALETLYEETQDGPALLDIVRRRVDAAADQQEQKQLLFRQARLSLEVMQDAGAAIEVYEAILDIELDGDAVAHLERLYTATGRWTDLVGLYERQFVQASADKPHLHVRIARTAREHLGDVNRAFDELEAALKIDAQYEGAIAELEHLLERGKAPEHRARAAEMLEPVYMRRADFTHLMAAIEARLASSQEPDQRRPLLKRLAHLKEEQTEDYRGALETVAKLLHDDLGDETTWGELERLAKVAAAQDRLAEIYAAELEALPADDGASARLCQKTGELYGKLGRIEPALRFYRRALTYEPDSKPLFEAIDALLIADRRPEQRVELYRAGLEHRYDASERLSLLHTIATLEKDDLGSPDRAIETYRAALEVDETDPDTQDALTALYRERGRFDDLAALYERRAEQSSDANLASSFRLSLARLFDGELANTSAAIDQYEQITSAVPDHAEAIADLEKLSERPEHKARIVDILRPLYERADDWRRLIGLNEQRLGLAQDRSDMVAILRETAELWESRGLDDSHALAALCQAFRIDPDDGGTRAELERVAAKTQSWDILARAYEEGIGAADPLVKRELLTSLAELHDQKRDDPRSALAAYERLFALDETDETPLTKMDELATLLSDWPALVRILTAKADLIPDDLERASLYRRVGEIKRDMLDNRQGATLAYERALELDPESSFTIDSLIELYERTSNHTKLVSLYRRRVELAGPEEEELKYQLLRAAAERYEQHLAEPREAIDCLREASAIRSSDRETLRALERLYRAEGMWAELLDNLRVQADTVEEVASRIRLRKEIGEIYAKRLDDPSAALDAYRQVLDEAPAEEDAIRAVMQLGEIRDDLSLPAAEILEPVLRNAGQFETLVAVLELRARAELEPFDRARTLSAIAAVLDGSLHRPADALDTLIRALAETPEDQILYSEIERLARASGRFARYAEALEERANAMFDGSIALELWKRLGIVAESELRDDARAIHAYVKAGEHAGDEPETLSALDRLYSRTGDLRALADILERRVAIESDAKAQGELFYRLADLQIARFGQKAQGLATLKQAIERDPDHEGARQALESLTADARLFDEAAEALEAVYRARVDHDRLVALYEKRVSFADGIHERTRVRLELSRLLEDQVRDTRRAQKVVEEALLDNPTDTDVLVELERLAEFNQGWVTAAESLAKAIAAASDLSADSARDAYVRLAIFYETHLSSAAEAEAALKHAIARDPENIEILTIHRTSAAVSGTGARAGGDAAADCGAGARSVGASAVVPRGEDSRREFGAGPGAHRAGASPTSGRRRGRCMGPRGAHEAAGARRGLERSDEALASPGRPGHRGGASGEAPARGGRDRGRQARGHAARDRSVRDVVRG